MKKNILLISINLLLLINPVKSQQIDLDFQTPELYDYAEVYETLKLSNGQIIVIGDIDYANDKPVQGVVKINPDGSLDENFEFNHDLATPIANLAENSLGEIIFASRRYLGKMNNDGELLNIDEDFEGITDLAIQSDDKIVLSRSFVSNPLDFITRVNSDLSIDEDFSANTSANNSISSVEIKGDKIYVSGNFSQINGKPINDIAKLNLDGTLDETFDPGSGTNDRVGEIKVQEDGKVLIGNSYINSFNDIMTDGMVRLNADGSIDQSFADNFPQINGPTSNIFIHENKIYLSAFYEGLEGYEIYLFRLNMDGSRDNSFVPIIINDNVYENGLNLVFENDGLVLGGNVSSGPFNLFSKYDFQGSSIAGFSVPLAQKGSFSSIKKLNDKLYVIGSFYQISDQTSYNLARLNLDGSVDPEFSMQQNLGGIFQIEFTKEEKILLNAGESFIRLNKDASIDPDFSYENFKDMSGISKFHILENDKIMIFGPNNFYRLNPDGSEDISYMNGEGTGGPNGGSTNFAFQSDGKMIVSGIFDSYDNQPVSGIIRLNEDGTLDESFDVNNGITGGFIRSPLYLNVFSNDSIFISGLFDEYDGQDTNGVVQLGPDGELLTLNAFPNQTICLTEYKNSMLLQFYNDSLKKYVWQRRYFDGSVDSTFVKPSELINLSAASQLYRESSTSKTAYVVGRFDVEGESISRNIIKVSLNRAPAIDSQLEDIKVLEDSAFNITKETFTTSDVDDPVQNLSLILMDGENYTLNSDNIIPDQDYNGDLNINIALTDGLDTSVTFQAIAKVEPVNDVPIITAYSGMTVINEDDSLAIEIGKLQISDPDNSVDNMRMILLDGDNYTVDENVVYPELNYYGKLKLNLRVSDQVDTSNAYLTEITVSNVNDTPNITGQTEIPEINSEGLEIKLNQLTVTDPDNTFPNDFSLNILPSDNYSLSEGLITSTTEADTLEVSLTVSDGQIESDVYIFKAITSFITASKDKNSIQARAYPNPAKNHLTIISENFGIRNQLVLINQRGLKLKEVTFTDKIYHLNTKDISPGMYFIRIKTDNNQWLETKFLKLD
ncbi:delta-60 repeat domain-containing protein/Por secretion system C-terminal sorting domain-containing protein [Marivirga sericea]|uniref:Delta-60 repeat domain-containing protein/Por secretion system C-terminal sorting domain-containing protein n=1 Tax=Marivirga sericea TaxID=1028 RepID=A0A1X7KAC7_9BACT|nr:T9SS type A sorting domain-containing protein [Marivirga sericea]SMG37806.1 delta-60 repeat domain-containing protein/Por secretion system C-terminal sorting domain-containing protein [Marivirga sericea]